MNAEVLVGLLLPPLIDLVNKDVESDTRKFIIACCVSLVAAALISYPQLSRGNTTQFLASVGIVFTEAQIVFNTYWKNSLPRKKMLSKLTPVAIDPEIAASSWTSPAVAGQVVAAQTETNTGGVAETQTTGGYNFLGVTLPLEQREAKTDESLQG